MSGGGGVGVPGGRFDFDDGGTYCGGWEDGKAHGHGVCTGPKSQGEYSGSWHFGFEVSGVYTWPSGSTYEGQWQNGKRHGLGVETRGRWTYRGEWTQGFKGRYGIRQSVSSGAKYEGTWANGLQDGYGSETYADGGTFQGQWMRGMRHGYGVRTSASFGLASHYRPKSVRSSLSSIPPGGEAGDPASDRDRKIDDFRGGFVLKSRSDEPPARRRSLVEKSTNLKKSILQGLKIKKQRSTGDIDRRGVSSIRSSGSNLSSASSESGHSGSLAHSGGSIHTDSNVSFVSQDELCDTQVTETYLGEWKNDRRCGYGIAERSDGLKYEGEWYNNKKYGYGVTTLKDGTREEGKYKNNVLVSSGKKKHLFMLRSAKFKERIDASVNASARASQIALQKADIAISRTATSRGKSEQADVAAIHAQEDSNIARLIAKQFDPDAKIPDMMKNRMNPTIPSMRVPFTNLSNQTLSPDTPDGSRTESSLDGSRRNLSARNMSPQQSSRYGATPPQPPPPPQQQERYMSPTPVVQTQFPSQQNAVPMPQSPYQHQNAVHQQYPQDPRYQQYPGSQQQQYPGSQQQQYPGSQQQQYPGSQQQYPGPQQQQPYMNNPQGYAQYPSQQQQYQKMNSNYLGASQDPPPVPNRQGSFRHRPSARGGGEYSMQQAMGDHFDHYRQQEAAVARPRNVIKHGRRIPSPQRGMTPVAYPPQQQGYSPRTSYGPDATPDSGVSESMDELSPSRFGRKSHLPPMIYGSSQASSLLSFAPSDEGGDGRTMSPTMSSVGSEVGSEVFPRTASLYVNPPSRKKQEASGGGGGGALNRKKSMPHGPKELSSTPQKVIPREEVAFLSSQRREEVRRQNYEAERLRSNPLLYLVRPDLKDWFSRQQMIMLVLFINISLAIMFYKLLS